MASNCMKMLLRMLVICGVVFLSGASPKRGHDVGRERRKEYLNMHMNNGTISCIDAQKACRSNKECWRAMRGLHKTCSEKSGQCNTNLKDLVKCADLMDIIRKDIFPKERCSCSGDGSLFKCFDIGNKVYSNPCFDQAKALRDAMMTTTPASVVNDVTQAVSKGIIRHQFVGAVDGLDKGDVEEASIFHLREKGMFPTTTAITTDPKNEVIVPDITTAPDVDIEDEFIQEEVNILSEHDIDVFEDEEYDYISNYDATDEEVIEADEEVIEEDVEIDERTDEIGSFFEDGIDIDSNVGIDDDFLFHKEVQIKKSENKNYRQHPMENVVTVPSHVEVNSPKVKFSNHKTSRGVNRPIEVKSSLLYSEVASQDTPQDVSMSNRDYANMGGIDIKIIAIICGTLLAMFITASLVFIAYIRTHGQPSYVSGKKVKTKEATPNKRQIVGNLA